MKNSLLNVAAGFIAFAIYPVECFANGYNQLQAPVCDMAEALAGNAMHNRLSGKSYTEAMQLQRDFMAKSKLDRRNYEIQRFVEEIGLDLVDRTYEAQIPNDFKSGDQMADFIRQWGKSKTQWCR